MNTVLTAANGMVETPRVLTPQIPAVPPSRESAVNGAKANPEVDAPMSVNPRSGRAKRWLLAGLVVVVGFGIAKFGHDWWTVGRFVESTDDAYVGGDVTVIAPKVPGFIAEVAVSDNQAVRAGDLLVRLDDRDYRAALAKADAEVANQQASLTTLDALSFLQEAIVTQAEAEVASTEAELSRSRDDQARYLKLSTNGAVSIQSLQRADADYQQAFAGEQKARAGLAAAQRQVAVIATQKQQAEAALGQAIAEREMARLNLSYTELRAPIDGTVGNRSAHTGAYATTGSQLISLVPTRGLWIDANYKENQLARIHAGLPASVTVDVTGQTFRGHVASVAPATGAQFSVLPPENATGNFTKIVQRVAVRIVLDDEAATLGQLRPGLSVTTKVDGRTVGKAAL